MKKKRDKPIYEDDAKFADWYSDEGGGRGHKKQGLINLFVWAVWLVVILGLVVWLVSLTP